MQPWFLSHPYLLQWQSLRLRISWVIVLFYTTAAEYTFFLGTHGTFSRIDHTLGHKTSLNKFKKIEIISNIFSDHIHVVAYYRISFLRLNNISVYVYTTFCLSISFIRGHLGVSISAVMNNASMNMGVQISLQDPASNSLGYVPRCGIVGSYGNSIF